MGKLGYCPKCHESILIRERRDDGRSICSCGYVCNNEKVLNRVDIKTDLGSMTVDVDWLIQFVLDNQMEYCPGAEDYFCTECGAF